MSENEIIKNLSSLNSGVCSVLPITVTCLEKSFALWIHLRKNGIKSDLKIGVKHSNDKFLAHSWLEVNGRVISDREDINKEFTTLEPKGDNLISANMF